MEDREGKRGLLTRFPCRKIVNIFQNPISSINRIHLVTEWPHSFTEEKMRQRELLGGIQKVPKGNTWFIPEIKTQVSMDKCAYRVPVSPMTYVYWSRHWLSKCQSHLAYIISNGSFIYLGDQDDFICTTEYLANEGLKKQER